MSKNLEPGPNPDSPARVVDSTKQVQESLEETKIPMKNSDLMMIEAKDEEGKLILVDSHRINK